MTDDLKLLGSANTDYPTEYSPGILECFENKFPSQRYVVTCKCPEFTSLCPKTKQPDFAEILIEYEPMNLLVESKSLKLYLFSFRNEGSFHEDCVNKIARDLALLLSPKWIRVTGKFLPRGGISIHPVAEINLGELDQIPPPQ